MEKETLTRMVEEFNQLLEKIEKLTAFLNDDSNELDPLNRDLLVAQYKAMESYLSILHIRIGYNLPQNNEVIEEEVE